MLTARQYYYEKLHKIHEQLGIAYNPVESLKAMLEAHASGWSFYDTFTDAPSYARRFSGSDAGLQHDSFNIGSNFDSIVTGVTEDQMQEVKRLTAASEFSNDPIIEYIYNRLISGNEPYADLIKSVFTAKVKHLTYNARAFVIEDCSIFKGRMAYVDLGLTILVDIYSVLFAMDMQIRNAIEKHGSSHKCVSTFLVLGHALLNIKRLTKIYRQDGRVTIDEAIPLPYKEQETIALEISMNALTFIIAHEVSHHILGHLSSQQKMEIGVDINSEDLARINIKNIENRHLKEHEADLLAAKLCMQCFLLDTIIEKQQLGKLAQQRGKRLRDRLAGAWRWLHKKRQAGMEDAQGRLRQRDMDEELAISAIMMVFFIFEKLEEVGSDDHSTHPSATSRQQVVTSSMRTYCSQESIENSLDTVKRIQSFWEFKPNPPDTGIFVMPDNR
jgi:hypothetical protein